MIIRSHPDVMTSAGKFRVAGSYLPSFRTVKKFDENILFSDRMGRNELFDFFPQPERGQILPDLPDLLFQLG